MIYLSLATSRRPPLGVRRDSERAPCRGGARLQHGVGEHSEADRRDRRAEEREHDDEEVARLGVRNEVSVADARDEREDEEERMVLVLAGQVHVPPELPLGRVRREQRHERVVLRVVERHVRHERTHRGVVRRAPLALGARLQSRRFGRIAYAHRRSSGQIDVQTWRFGSGVNKISGVKKRKQARGPPTSSATNANAPRIVMLNSTVSATAERSASRMAAACAFARASACADESSGSPADASSAETIAASCLSSLSDVARSTPPSTPGLSARPSASSSLCWTSTPGLSTQPSASSSLCWKKTIC